MKRRQVLTRGGARAGDEIYVSGTIGAAAAGLQMRSRQHRAVARHDRDGFRRDGLRAPASRV